MRLAIVLYDGNVGGAEKVTAALAAALRESGIDATVLFVRDPKSLANDLERLGVPYLSFGAKRVEQVLWQPRRFARFVAEHGRDGALLPAVGHQAPALRIGGYRGPVVAMEHGFLLMMDAMTPLWRLGRRIERIVSAPFVDVEVAVSDFMLERVGRNRGEPRAIRIYNGVALRDRPDLSGQADHDGMVTFAHAARLIEGKGTDICIEAFARSDARASARLVIAGDGPEKAGLEQLASEHGVADRVEFVGIVADMADFWGRADVVVLPSGTFIESFGMVAVEAMSLGKPVIATRNGAVPEVLGDDAGIIVEPGDPDALARAIDRYVRDPQLRRAHGASGRRRCEEVFAIEHCADEFARLFTTLGGRALAPGAPALESVHA